MSTNPIPFSEYLKIVVVADPENQQFRELVEHGANGSYNIEFIDNNDRDVYEDADAGAFVNLASRASPGSMLSIIK